MALADLKCLELSEGTNRNRNRQITKSITRILFALRLSADGRTHFQFEFKADQCNCKNSSLLHAIHIIYRLFDLKFFKWTLLQHGFAYQLFQRGQSPMNTNAVNLKMYLSVFVSCYYRNDNIDSSTKLKTSS